MNSLMIWLEQVFEPIPLPLLDIWGHIGYFLGLFLMVSAFGGFTFRPGGRWGLGRERQAWDAKALLSIALTFILVFTTGYIGSFFVLVPGAQTFESLKDLSVLLCILIFGYPALLAVPFVYGLSDLIEGVPPSFLLDWIEGYFINPSCFWVAYQLIGKDPDFKKGKTWGGYLLFVLIFMSIEPQLWGYICSNKFTPEISYRTITPALFFTTGLTWIIAPFAMLVAYPLAKKYNMFWAEISGHVKERKVGAREWVWRSGKEGSEEDDQSFSQALPIRIFILTPLIVFVFVIVIATAYISSRSAENTAMNLASRLHNEISERTKLQLDDYFETFKINDEARLKSDLSKVIAKTSLSKQIAIYIIDRSGNLVVSSVSASPDLKQKELQPVADGVLLNAVSNLNRISGGLETFNSAKQYPFDIISAKPLFRKTWLAQANPYVNQSASEDWIVLTVMPESYYLEGVQLGNAKSGIIFAIGLTLALLVAVLLADILARPIGRISIATRALALGEFSQKVPSSLLAELDSLSISFNNMMEQLRESIERTRLSEQQFHDLVDTSPGVVWEATIDTFDFTYVSQQAVNLFGYSVEEWKQSGFWLEHLYPEDKKKAVGFYSECVNEHKTKDLEYRLLHKSGNIVWVSDTAKLITLSDSVKFLRGVMVDVSERKKIEEKLLEHSRLIETIVDLTPDVLYIYDLEERKNIYSNHGIVNTLGYTPSELQSMGDQIVPTLMHPDDFKTYLTEIVPLYHSLGDKTVIHHEYRMRHKLGEWKWLISAELIYKRSHTGAPKQIFGITHDITNAKQAEETILDLNANLERKIELRTLELKSSNEELIKTINHLENIMKELQDAQEQLLLSEKLAALGRLSAGMAHELNTPLGAISSANKTILKMLDTELKEIPELLSNLNNEERESFRVLLVECMLDAALPEHLPDRSLRKKMIQTFRDAGIRNPEESAVIVIETGVHKLGERLLKLLNTERSSDLLSALNTISSIARLANVISVANGKASYVVEALRNYLSPEGRDDEELSSVDIRSEIETLLALYHNKIKYGVEVLRIYNTDNRCIGNGNKLNQVWINLINNGLQSMEYSGKIEIEINKMDSWIVTSITDSGPGIPVEIQSKIFNPFFTTKKHGEGIGIGLDICKKIIEKMGGKIEFESKPGKTKFSVWLKSAD
ncbi:PAS domain-containing sensor histidine kinase [Leptospira perolatii]|uniref:histidine kinase n=1 Tax=Leptospira perolatii TaxID=2023191 RepID=A0A2M9ZQP8_9LEPT|nr:PAS domain-containing protein [Leptospira perolatii]PJZ70443.1 PAS domain-containing sensor histidine kinase [Leptospira perolatii]PJZ74279.1 PAS domain-containing sensor histidine kinase [Leptospira perolatii]